MGRKVKGARCTSSALEKID
jgi:hypothetical protein